MKEAHELVRVYSAGTLLEGEAVKAYLTSQGIPVFLKYDTQSNLGGITSGSLGGAMLLVPAEKAADANELIAQIDKKPIKQKQPRKT